MTSWRVIWSSTRTGRSYSGVTPYTDRDLAQKNADLSNDRFAGLGLEYKVEPVDDTPDGAPEPEVAK